MERSYILAQSMQGAGSRRSRRVPSGTNQDLISFADMQISFADMILG